MAKQLNYKQFLQMWYNRCGIKNKAVESHMDDIYNGLLSVIQEEVRLNGEIRLKNLGKFYLLETGGYERKATMVTTGNENTRYFVPVHYIPKFTASQNFKDYVNDAIVSKEGRRNLKNGKLTALEQELLEREAEKDKTDIRRILERKMATGEDVKTITQDSRMKMKRRD